MDRFRSLMEGIGIGVDGIGVLAVLAGVLWAAYRYLRDRPRSSYRVFRQDLGRAILLGLEFLVAGDIIRTVVVSPSLQNVIILAMIVLIRTFLSFALEMELDGRPPWKARPAEQGKAG